MASDGKQKIGEWFCKISGKMESVKHSISRSFSRRTSVENVWLIYYKKIKIENRHRRKKIRKKSKKKLKKI